ncbi:MAG: hypothetical protein KC593_04340 [Myxococcales bacterium]|nr:hypothetical protein [Myxococcales bacterium]MCB9629935.1 hypothetical protein [Sandaracinaceae bacterium]
MRSDAALLSRYVRAALASLALTLGACVDAGVVLERSTTDGSVPDSAIVADAALDQSDDTGPLDNGAPPDAGPGGNVTIYLTGFEAYAGMTIRARLGALSSVIASAVIQPDGTAVIILNQIFTILSSTYFESYVDVDGSGSCSSLNDHLAAANVFLTNEGNNYRVNLDEADTSAPLLGCLVLN